MTTTAGAADSIGISKRLRGKHRPRRYSGGGFFCPGGGNRAPEFLACVIVAGAYGAWSVSRRILWLQAAPAAVALGLLFAASA